MPDSPDGRRARRCLRSLIQCATALLVAVSPLVVAPVTAHASNEQVNVWLTSTSDSGGRTVTRGLSAGNSGSGQAVTVDENTRSQQFTGAGRPSPTPPPG